MRTVGVNQKVEALFLFLSLSLSLFQIKWKQMHSENKNKIQLWHLHHGIECWLCYGSRTMFYKVGLPISSQMLEFLTSQSLSKPSTKAVRTHAYLLNISEMHFSHWQNRGTFILSRVDTEINRW